MIAKLGVSTSSTAPFFPSSTPPSHTAAISGPSVVLHRSLICLALSNLLKHKHTVEANHFPLLLNLFLWQICNSLLDHSVEKIISEMGIAVVFISWLQLLIEVLVEIRLFLEF